MMGCPTCGAQFPGSAAGSPHCPRCGSVIPADPVPTDDRETREHEVPVDAVRPSVPTYDVTGQELPGPDRGALQPPQPEASKGGLYLGVTAGALALLVLVVAAVSVNRSPDLAERVLPTTMPQRRAAIGGGGVGADGGGGVASAPLTTTTTTTMPPIIEPPDLEERSRQLAARMIDAPPEFGPVGRDDVINTNFASYLGALRPLVAGGRYQAGLQRGYGRGDPRIAESERVAVTLYQFADHEAALAYMPAAIKQAYRTDPTPYDKLPDAVRATSPMAFGGPAHDIWFVKGSIIARISVTSLARADELVEPLAAEQHQRL